MKENPWLIHYRQFREKLKFDPGNPSVIEFLYAMSKKHKVERELELTQSACMPYASKEQVNSYVEDRRLLLHSPFDFVVAQTDEDAEIEKTKVHVENIRAFKRMVKGK